MRMMRVFLGALVFAGTLAGVVLSVEGAWAAGEPKQAKDVAFSFEGPFGTFDKAQLQRGFQVYQEVCSACHSLNYVAYRSLGDEMGPGFSEAEVKAIAAQKEVSDGPNGDGEMFTRPAVPSDKFVPPYPNAEAATAANGAYPPDLSLITKARAGYHGTVNQFFNGIGGPEYIYSVLTGYQEAPEEVLAHETPPATGHYNPYFSKGHWISMPPPLSDDQIEYADGTSATVEQMAKDVAAFLAWSAEPQMVTRKEMGLKVMIFLIILTGLLYFSYQRVWAQVEH